MADYTDLRIEPNAVNGGISALFNVGEQQYYADIADLPFCGVECMIFKSKDGQVIDWLGEYCRRGLLCNEHSLKECIEEFVSSLS